MEIHTNGRKDGNGCHGQNLNADKGNKRAEPAPSRELNRLALSAFTLVETLHAPSNLLPPHAHAAASICLTLAGQGREINGGDTALTVPGSLIMRAPGLIHSNQYGGGAAHRSLMIEIQAGWLETCRQFTGLFTGYKQFSGGPVTQLALRTYQESKIIDSAAPIIVEGLMLEMLGHASRSLFKPPVRLPYWLTQARDLLHGHFHDALNLVNVAETIGVHPTHLARTFKRHYGSTVGEYIRRLRLDWATRRLAETEDPISEIAAAAGFYDQSHFSHLFKQHTGFTPAEFRSSSHEA